MNAQDLKNSILQLAIKGKLVEQSEEEGTSEELYQQIQEEKQRLIDEGIIRKQKELPEITAEEIPFDIPETWKWVKLGDVIDLLSGQDMPSTNYNDEMMGIPYITGASNIEDSQVIINRWTEQPRSVAEKGQLLLTCKGTIGKTAILDIEKAHIARQIMSINPLKNDVKYFKVYINSYVNELKRQAKSMIPGINRSVILDAPFPMPPLKEQKRIVAKIEELMPYVERHGDAYEQVTELNRKFPLEMEKSILQYAIQGKLVGQSEEEGTAEELYKQIQEEKQRLIDEGTIRKQKELPEITDEEIPFDIPSGWKWVRLGDVTHNWGQKKPETTFDYIDVASIDNIKGVLSEEENLIEPENAPSRARKIVKENTVLFSTVRPYLLNICVVDRDFRFQPITSTAFSVLHPFNKIYSLYLFYLLRSPMFIGYVNSKMTGVTYPAINDKNLLNGAIPIPPYGEQKRIVAKIEELMVYTKQLVKGN